MGLKDRLGAAKRYLWSPMDVHMLESGSDPVVRAGQPATVVVELKGEDDGSLERVEVTLSLNHRTRNWVLGEVPATAGRHELQVTIPAEAPPTTRYTEYRFVGKLHRTKGTPAEGVSLVRVIGHPDHVYRPDGPDSEGGVLSLDADSVAVGGTVSGHSRRPGTVAFGAVVDSIRGQEGSPNGVHKVEFKPLGEIALDAPGPFAFAIPAGAPPTFHDGGTTYVTWEVRTGDAWHRFTVLDPDGLAEVPEQKASGLLDVFY